MDRIIRVDLVAMASSRSFPVALASARQARAWLAEVIAPDELAVAERQRFEVALTELITNLVQHTAPTPGQPEKQALPLPIRLRLRNGRGQVVPLPAHADALGDELIVMRGDASEFCAGSNGMSKRKNVPERFSRP